MEAAAGVGAAMVRLAGSERPTTCLARLDSGRMRAGTTRS